MRRVVIVGNSGGGKSTLARRLGEKLGLPVVHLDVLYWKPGWTPGDEAGFVSAMSEAVGPPAWICDGDFGDTWSLRMPLADTIVWIDRPRMVCLWRAIRRVVTSRNRGRPDMAEGCEEAFDPAFYRFIWTYDEKVRPRLKAALATHGAQARQVRLRSDREIANFLAHA